MLLTKEQYAGAKGVFCEFCSHQTFLEKDKGNWQYFYQIQNVVVDLRWNGGGK